MKVKRLGDLTGFIGRRYGRFRVRDIRGRNVMVNELHDVHVQSIVEITDEGETDESDPFGSRLP